MCAFVQVQFPRTHLQKTAIQRKIPVQRATLVQHLVVQVPRIVGNLTQHHCQQKCMTIPMVSKVKERTMRRRFRCSSQTQRETGSVSVLVSLLPRETMPQKHCECCSFTECVLLFSITSLFKCPTVSAYLLPSSWMIMIKVKILSKYCLHLINTVVIYKKVLQNLKIIFLFSY